jgi:Skp family chaperone for outer membrane proteins
MKINAFIARRALASTGFAIATALFLSVPTAGWAQSHPSSAPAAQPVPAPKILVIDRQALLRASSVGQDIARQVQALSKSAEGELKGEGDSLRKEEIALQQQVAILAPDVKAQKIKAFEEKQAAFQKKVQDRQNQIRYGVALAQRQVEMAAGPIVQGIMQERGANLMLDRQAIVIGAPGLDITPLAIQRLNQKLPSVKVQLVTPPPDVLARMQQAAQ